MKNYKHRFMPAAVILIMLLLLTGCSGEKKDTSDTSSEVKTVSENTEVGDTNVSDDINSDYILDKLQTYGGEIKSIDLDKQIAVPVHIKDGEESDIEVFKFVPDTSGVYDLEVIVPENCDGKTFVSIIDQNANTLNEFPDTSASMVIGQQYFLVFYTETDSSDKEVSFELKVTLKFADDAVEFEELKTGENLFTIKTEAEVAAAFFPEESGYYRLDAYCLDSEYGTAAINAVLKQGGDDVKGASDLFYMEEGSAYFIVYGVYETGTEKADVCIDIEPFDVIEIEKQKTITTDKDVILVYIAEASEDVFLYSVSDGDPKAVVYNQEFDVIAQNSDADGEFSENDHDFAMIIPAEKDDTFYIVVDNVEGYTCEIHLEKNTDF